MKRIFLISAVVSTIFAAGVQAGSEHHTHWGYSGSQGPEKWSTLSEENKECGIGTRQSPIDIDEGKSVKTGLETITFNYSPVNPEILNNGHTVQLNYTPGSYIEVGGVRYDLLQFHFHSPSENTVSGRPYDMEMHLVHKSKLGKLAVVGIFIKQGQENLVLKTAWSNMPAKAGGHQVLPGAKLNAADLLPSNKAYSHFKGSLTTPPCSEGVNWFVMKNPIELSKQQVATFIKVIGNNARPVQTLNDRFVLSSD